VSIEATDATASEFGLNNTGTFTITRTGGTADALTVALTAAGTATKAMDYKALASTVTIPAGKSSVTVEVSPKDDALLEGDETMIVSIGAGTTYLIDGAAKSDTIMISDDEVPTVAIVATAPNAAEPTTKGLFTVSRTGPTTKALTVDLTVGGSATNGTDDDSIDTSITIAAGKASATITVNPTDDTSVEGKETVTLGLKQSDSYETNDDLDTATVTIKDDDKPSITIAASDKDAAEEDTAGGTFTITRTGVTTEALTVNLAITGTATNGTDYTKLLTAVTIDAGDKTATLDVTPVDDSTVEVDETVIATVAANANYVVGTDKSATVTIAENDLPTVTFTSKDLKASEPGTDKATLTVTRNGPTTDSMDVKYEVTGTATEDDDYTALTGTAMIPPAKRRWISSLPPRMTRRWRTAKPSSSPSPKMTGTFWPTARAR